jgi:hypothetical protein
MCSIVRGRPVRHHPLQPFLIAHAPDTARREGKKIERFETHPALPVGSFKDDLRRS